MRFNVNKSWTWMSNKISLKSEEGFNGYFLLDSFYPLKVNFNQCDQKKSPNAYKSCPKLISLENDRFLTPLQKLPKNVGDLGK